MVMDDPIAVTLPPQPAGLEVREQDLSGWRLDLS